MNGQEIIEMAKETGLNFYDFVWTSPTKENLYPEGVNQKALEAFAKLVAAKEREACAERAWLALVKHKQPWNVRQDVTDAIRARDEA